MVAHDMTGTSADGAAPRALPRPGLALLVAVSAVNPLAVNIFLPSLPAMTTSLGTTYAMVQLTLSLYLATMAVAQVIIGPLSDRYGRRPVLLAGMAIFVVGSIIAVSATSIEVLLAARVLQGAGGCAGIVLARAIVRDLYDRERAASMIGYVTMGMAVAPMVAPAFGGFLETIVGWRGGFAVMLIAGLLVYVWAFAALHETHHRRGPAMPVGEMLAEWRRLLAMPLFWAYAGTAAASSAVFFAFLGGAPLVSTAIMHVTPIEYGLYFALVSLGYMAGNFLTGRHAQRIGVARMITLGNLIQIVAIILMIAGFAGGLIHPITLFGPMLLVGLGNGMSLPSAIAGAVSIDPALAGSASGLTGSLQIGLGALASSVTGALVVVLWPGTAWALILIMTAASLLAFVTGVAVQRLQAPGH